MSQETRFGGRSRRPRARRVDPTAENIDLLAGEDDNLFADRQREAHGMDFRARKIFVVCIVLAVVYVVALLMPQGLVNPTNIISPQGGRTGYTFAWFVDDLSANLAYLAAAVTGQLDGPPQKIIDFLVVAAAGAGLALSGAVYQGAFRNALVSPSTLGVMTGSQLGLLVWVVVFIDGGILTTLGIRQGINEGYGWNVDGAERAFLEVFGSDFGLAVLSFIGCLLVVGIVLLVQRVAGAQKLSGIMLIITGQVVAGCLGVIGTVVRYYYATVAPDGEVALYLQELQISSFFREFTWGDVAVLFGMLGLTFAVVMRLRQKMMLLALDKTEQRTMGIETGRMQLAVVGTCTLLTAVVVSFCGAVGFVGFLVPHLARRLVGPNFKYLLPASAVIGALFVVAAYSLIMTTLGGSYATMTGMYISIGGAVVFLVTALRGKGVSLGTFR